MKKLRLFLGTLAVLAGLVGPVLVPQGAVAQAPPVDPKGEALKGVEQIGGAGRNDFPAVLRNVINTLLFIIGAIAVLMIVIGGLRYVTSGGESSSVTGAKNTILYAIIGLIVALMAYGIINFVLNSLG